MRDVTLSVLLSVCFDPIASCSPEEAARGPCAAKLPTIGPGSVADVARPTPAGPASHQRPQPPG